MTIALDDDLSLCTDFDVNAVFATTPTPTTIPGVLNESSDAVFVGGQLEIEAMEPSFIVRAALMTPAIVQGVSVTIGGNTYTVRRIQKVGQGQTILYLKT